jgi:hypothetical protein
VGLDRSAPAAVLRCKGDDVAGFIAGFARDDR